MMAHFIKNSTETIIMAALSTLSPSHLSHLTHSISAVFHRHLHRRSALLSSPPLFSLTLRHLQSLSLHHKSLLIARHLLSNLTLLTHFIQNATAAGKHPSPPCIKLRDLDAVLLLLLLCELHQHDRKLLDAPPSRWRVILCDYFSNSILKLSSYGGCFSNSEILIQYIESVVKCWNLVTVMGCGGEGKEDLDGAASPAAVVALPSVELTGGKECVICKEEMKEGREVCEMPCGHLFHWVCILRWLKKRSTCPCCRRRLPTDDVRRETERLLEELAKVGGGGGLNQGWL
ncbi:Anaphase-promoting complex (APC), subunit 11 [Handroanthus impetiginosus]|uniref:RING-type E3 ubiquitin transferase n=1 Tax=Handroanthus impetiginosus TaxID=429701 RepID=A0A2G9GS53_9LAMI|nr:Anaphase-promoting complex (APC), subunit 11 [Handroanthus impetiginosus]